MAMYTHSASGTRPDGKIPHRQGKRAVGIDYETVRLAQLLTHLGR
jgi:hypothetical protein